MQTKRTRLWIWLLSGVATCVGLLLLSRQVLSRAQPTSEKPQTSAPLLVVTAEPAKLRPLKRTVQVVGTLFGWEEISITPKLEGRVKRLYHDVGDVVQPGEPLLEVDPTDFALSVKEAERAVEFELARVGLKELPSKTFPIGSLPGVQRAASLEKQATQHVERVRALVANRAASTEEIEKAEAEVKVAKANYEVAKQEAEATLAAARHRHATLELAQQRLLDTKIVAPKLLLNTQEHFTQPLEYVITERNVAEGEMIRTFPGAESAQLFRLVVARTLKLRATVPERHRSEVQLGQEVELEVESFPGRKFTGKVARVHPAIDRASRTFKAEIMVPNESRQLSPGSFAKVSIFVKQEANACTVPEEALVRFAGVTKVFVLAAGKAQAVPVEAGQTLVVVEAEHERTWVEVRPALPEDALVITSGQLKLADGVPVRLRSVPAQGTVP